MAHRKYRWVGLGMLATGGASILGMTSMLHPASALADGGVDAAAAVEPSNYALVLGPGGFGTVSDLPLYGTQIEDLYLNNDVGRGVPDGITGSPFADLHVPDSNVIPVDTPEGVLTTSLGVANAQVDQAATELNNAIQSAIGEANGGQVVVFGYSESATVAYLEEAQLQAQASLGHALPYSPDQLSFVLLGDPSNPDGGLYERLVPSLPTDLPYHTDIYTQEYDGFADFPRYPSDFLADANAVAGALYDHLDYADLTPSQIGSALPLDSTDPNSDYFIIPTTDLPLLEPLRLLGEPGNAMADLLQPDATLLVNLGYGNLSFTEGYDTGPANVPTPFGTLPDVNTSDLATMLQQGMQQGMAAATADVGKSFTLGSSPALEQLEQTAYTFGVTDTPTPQLQDFLTIVGQWGADELGFGSTYAGIVNDFAGLTQGFQNLEGAYQTFQSGFTNFESGFTNLESLLSEPWTLGGASAADALTSGALDATPLATSMSDLATDFLSQLPGLF